MHLKAVSMPRTLIAAPWCPHFIYSITTRWYNCKRKYWNIHFPCVSFLWATEMSHTVKQPIRADLNIEPHCETASQSRAQHWAALWNSQSEQSSTLSRTVKQPIRAELKIEPHCETASQSRAQHWAALWNSQSEQSSTLSRTVKQPIRADLNIEPHCETANQSRAQHWAALWNSQSEQISTLSRTVKQPIRADLNIEPHCETANQSRSQHWAALWNSQSEQSSTLLFMTLPNKPITDRFILGRNPRVVNAHVKPFLENFCPLLSHIPSM